ncbi:hypothetical protein [Pseudorhodoferax sp. Leaf267]|jgi:hypothetical protein|uniref:hypothetical protein n=1 Tax=Pseudorhodoferax sp. Leaf267 TaxID=1736316 RepID=UPI0012E2909A|nr:hypothetical protein [Pseudorhodoferax sp. Leaf267]
MIEMASPVKWLIDVLKDFDKRRIANNEERFRLFFETTYLDLLAIHRNHIEMLRKCETELPAFLSLNGKAHTWYAGMNAEILSREEVPEQVERVKRLWQSAREESGGDRVKLRALSSELIKIVDHPSERRYIFGVINYFIHPERMYIDAPGIDRKIKSLIDQGPDAILDSPSLTVWEQIRSEEDPDKIRHVFGITRGHLLARWSEVSERYAEVFTSHISVKA